ncbi:hypothetical protein AMATHDRAFT_169926 [Amanita thiersii Skay4041]|uniref:Inositol-pentakisphosphate 2-kinase n=1 Tax=Amanita thiersii Skay4041 TaxID=703135 RepID=A0A2A9NUL7_9AGAR|nr:hypothetical protein AMATHDRAFT_169926 [Amanita thiersii Skay4041]
MAGITSTRPGDWRYVSEGGATIVFSYIGPSLPTFNNTVLRLRKASLNSPGSYDQKDDPAIEYQEKCMVRLIPPIHLPRLESISLDRAWLEKMVETHDKDRPKERRLQDGIDLNRTKGTLATDLVGGNWIAVEIKPKWAFLPSPEHLSPVTRLLKTQTCRFCMHSRLRAARGETMAVGYCPLDLFSGEEGRVRYAISRLWDAWQESDGKMNNLKIFERGRSITPAKLGSLVASDVPNININIKEAFISAIVPILLGTRVLGTISKLQQTLDVLDIEGLSKLWQKIGIDPGEVMEITSSPESPLGTVLIPPFAEPTIKDWIEFIDIFLALDRNAMNHSTPDPQNLRYYLLAYLLSATFKDCSIIVRLDFLRSNSVEICNNVEDERVTVIDLDPKSMSRLRKWEKMDKEIVFGYMNLTQKVCVDTVHR